MILRVKKNVGFEAICSLRYEQGSRISTAGCGMRKTDQDISNCSVLRSITLTRGCLSLKKVYIPRIFLGLIHMLHNCKKTTNNDEMQVLILVHH